MKTPSRHKDSPPAAPVNTSILNGAVVRSTLMREVLDLVARIAPSDANVLLTGESGVGKEIIARAIHELGPRGVHDFVPINCSSLSDDTLENELFGHDEEEELPTLDLSLFLPITPPPLTPDTPAWRHRERRKIAHFLRSLSWLRRKNHTNSGNMSSKQSQSSSWRAEREMKRRCQKCYWFFADSHASSCCPHCGTYFAAKRYRCRRCHSEFEEPTRLHLCPRCGYPAPAQI